MPEFLLTSPEGKKFKVSGPEGSTPAQAVEKFKQMRPELFGQKPSEKLPSTVMEGVFPSKVPSDPAAEKPAQTVLGGVQQTLSDIPRELQRERAKAAATMRSGAGELVKGGLLHPVLGALEMAGGGLSYLSSPVTGLARALVFNPISRATGTPKVSEYGGLATDILATWPGVGIKALKALGMKGVPEVKGMGEALAGAAAPATAKSMQKGVLGAIENTFSPTTRTAESRAAGEVATEMLAKSAINTARTAQEFEKFEKVTAQMTPEAGTNFIRSMLGGGEVAEELRPLQTALRAEIDKRQNQLVNLGILGRFDEHYFPLIWKNPKAAIESVEAGNVLRPSRGGSIGGAPGSLRKRTLSGIDEGLARGLELASTNPLHLASHMITEMDRFLAARNMVSEFERVGAVKRIREGMEVPKLWEPVGDRLFGTNYYAPPSVKRIFDNITKPGLAGGPGFDKVRAFQNAMNRSQLSWPGFHFFFVNRDTVTSELARAVKQAAAGEFGGAAKRAALAFGDPTFGLATGVMKARKGNQLRQAMLEARPPTDELGRIAEAAIKGGARIGMDDYLRLTRGGAFWKSMKEGWLGADVARTWREGGLSAPFKILGRVIETMSAPLMEYYVPRAKLGVFYGMASDWLKLNPRANPTELRAAMQRIWDSVDNRMGEMVYDNLFWSRTQKDVAYMLTRSVGWNLGTVRELGGAVFDLARAGADVTKTGQLSALQRGFTERMAYATAMPLMTMFHGAMLTYMFTGKGPTSLLDYFFPPTGMTLRNGTKERISQPGYDKDVMEWMLHPMSTLVGKAHPTLPMLQELYQNRDWSGASIVTPIAIQQMQRIPGEEIAWNVFTDMMKYFGEKFLPIGQIGDLARAGISKVTGAKFARRRQEVAGEESDAVKALKLIGLSPAPIKLTDPERAEMLETLYSSLPAELKRQRQLR